MKATAKERILQTASTLFHQSGYTVTGINKIISESGTAKATFYSNFPSKKALGEAWLAEIHTSSEERRERLLNSEKSARSIVIEYFQELRIFLENGEFRGCPYTNTAAVISQEEDELQQQIEEHKHSIRLFFQTLASLEMKNNQVAHTLGDQLFILYSGATTESQNLRKAWPVDTATELAVELWDRAASAN